MLLAELVSDMQGRWQDLAHQLQVPISLQMQQHDAQVVKLVQTASKESAVSHLWSADCLQLCARQHAVYANDEASGGRQRPVKIRPSVVRVTPNSPKALQDTMQTSSVKSKKHGFVSDRMDTARHGNTVKPGCLGM